MNPPATNLAPMRPEKRSVVNDLAARYGMEPGKFCETLCATVFPKEGTNEEFLAFLLVAKEYNLNPITKEIYAFPKKGGGIQPIVSVDGWLNIINSHAQLDGIEFDDHLDDRGELTAITARIWRKDRAKPIVVTEYMGECRRRDKEGNILETWRTWPRRMLRHKALIQCARYAFGLSGIADPDEAERMGVSPMVDVTPRRDAGPPATHAPAAQTRQDEPRQLRGDTDEPLRATAATADDVFNGAEWLRNLEGAYSGCEDAASLHLVDEKLRKPNIEHALPPDVAKAEQLLRRHIDRLRAETEAQAQG